MTTHYKQHGGQFHFHDDLFKTKHVKAEGSDETREELVLDDKGKHIREEKLVHSSTEVAVAYCQLEDRVHVFTHGTAEGMKAWVEAHNAHSPHQASLKTFDQTTSADTLNKAISDPQFFSTLL